LSLVGGPAAIVFLVIVAGSAMQQRRGGGGSAGVVVFVAFLAMCGLVAAGLMAAVSLRNQERDAQISGRSLAITGMVAALFWSILVGEITMQFLRVLN
jgi:hypothetical protein